jgi:hypothetical protein
MRIRTAIPLALAAALCAGAPAPASVASAASSPSVRLVDCDPDSRSAAFEGDMRAIPGASRLQMRFTVERRESGGGDWERVLAPNLDTWVSSQAGRSRYVYTKHLEGLQLGIEHRVVVRFRWRTGGGITVRTRARRSKACSVPDPRPDLVPLSVKTLPGSTPDLRRYVVLVANRGRTDAPASAVALEVGDEPLIDQDAPAIDAGDRASVTFEGPACRAGSSLVATVDATGLVQEAHEADDVLAVACRGA